jgi:hypothetical protein
MKDSRGPPDLSPERQDVMTDSYAVWVGEQQIHAWQYRVTISDQDGTWQFVETLDRGDGPRLDLAYAIPVAPAEDDYWIYSKSYDCELDCA